ncbi:hypothetical protein MAR_002331 [Mya arenaria]|uniref:Apolipoprotein L3 n=1 Tax=Mya arenaria TaxID=6604 RepID=A0ABY7FEA2_MYAAR|nr:uncharacterized protein LOC128207232 [Mya arenaria]WAR20493.1 hypothetical protein MAR_002331 [Mya arenaria]
METDTIKEDLKNVLDSREETILVLNNLSQEYLKTSEKYNKTNIFTRVLSIVAGTASAGLAIATPFTAGLTGAPAVVLAGVSAASSAASLGASFAQNISDKGYMKQVHAVLEKDHWASARLERDLRAFLKYQSLAMDTTTLATSLANLGFHTLNKSAAILKASGKSMQIVDSITDAAELLGKASKVLTKVSKAVLVVSIPVDVILLIVDLKHCANYSEVEVIIQKAVRTLLQNIAVMKDLLAVLEG